MKNVFIFTWYVKINQFNIINFFIKLYWLNWNIYLKYRETLAQNECEIKCCFRTSMSCRQSDFSDFKNNMGYYISIWIKDNNMDTNIIHSKSLNVLTKLNCIQIQKSIIITKIIYKIIFLTFFIVRTVSYPFRGYWTKIRCYIGWRLRKRSNYLILL